MDGLEKWMETKKHIAVECDSLEEFNKRVGWHGYEGYVRLERCFWTAKNFPNTYLMKTLSYPKLTKASDFFRKIYLHKRTQQTRRKEICCPTCGTHQGTEIINPQPEPEGIFLHQDYTGAQMRDLLRGKEAKKLFTMWSSFYCFLTQEIELDIDMRYGGIEIIDRRPDGRILIAKCGDHINSDWLGIIKDWDIKLDDNFSYNKLQEV